MELLADDFTSFSRAARLLSVFVASPAKIHVLQYSSAKLLRLSTPLLITPSSVIKTPMLMFLQLLQAARHPQLLGNSPVETAQVGSWVELAHSLPQSQYLQFLNSHLRHRLFLVGSHLTLADIVAYAHFSSVPDTQKADLDVGKWTESVKNADGMKRAIDSVPMEAVADTVGSVPGKSTDAPSPRPHSQKRASKPAPKPDIDPFPLLNIRVGRVKSISVHPSRTHLYCQEVDLGTEVRTIASGLVNHVPMQQLQDSLVVVLTNLKERRMGEFASRGMLLCASHDGIVEPIRPPENSQPGDTVTIDGVATEPMQELPPKKGYWEQAQPQFSVAEDGCAMYMGKPLRTSQGTLRAPTLRSGSIS